ncbi:MAG: hypothetical protein OZSIB_2926 [Candidatus Ozemobacter sibiricus]|jgi:uncharacterized protein (DUF58 family)|uniref:DUF58 domain-containing protein n=1 Tax=Candidatus Ozemobacter sibiricus TaxID=2268124 RepID=A0A367ZR72_9BACT|nr:MAG: hypothetical protein OZSIB_2926 [Candidatus Ozemobacter sibiricus]
MLAFLAVFVGFAANNTGNNLLFLVVAGLVALLAVAAGQCYLNVAGLSLAWEGEAEGFVGDETSLVLQVEEGGRRSRFRLCVAQTRCLDLAQGARGTLAVRLRLQRRGRHAVTGLSLSSVFPLGLFRAEMALPPAVVWAFPQPRFAVLAGPGEKAAALRPDLFDQAGEFWMLVPYQDGQDGRRINWPISARSEGEWVVSAAVPRGDPVRVWLDPVGLVGEALERFLGQVTGLILRSRADQASLFVWCTPHGEPSGWVSVGEAGGCSRLLRWLAEVGPGPLPPPPGALSGAGTAFAPHRIDGASFAPEGGAG